MPTYAHIYKITRPPEGVGGGEGGGSYCADKCTVQYSRSLFYGQRKLCLALLSILTLRVYCMAVYGVGMYCEEVYGVGMHTEDLHKKLFFQR